MTIAHTALHLLLFFYMILYLNHIKIAKIYRLTRKIEVGQYDYSLYNLHNFHMPVYSRRKKNWLSHVKIQKILEIIHNLNLSDRMLNNL